MGMKYHKGMYAVSLEPSWLNTHESRCLRLYGCRVTVSEEPLKDAVCLGSVPYCRMLFGWPACDPYPDWLPWGRRIFRAGDPGRAFYKPADVPKRFESGVMECPPTGKWVASEIISFKEEHRAYVRDGKVVAVHPYEGTENPVQEFPWKIPGGITAAIDFGTLMDGRILPVEVNDPYALGWYGSLADYRVYAEFVRAGWEYMLSPRHDPEN